MKGLGPFKKYARRSIEKTMAQHSLSLADQRCSVSLKVLLTVAIITCLPLIRCNKIPATACDDASVTRTKGSEKSAK